MIDNTLVINNRPKVKSAHGDVVSYRLSEKELIAMRNKTIHNNGLTRESLIRAISSGETLHQVEKRKKMKPNEIYLWAKKWGLQGINKTTAIELMMNENMEAIEEEVKASVPDPQPVVIPAVVVEEKKEEVEPLKKTKYKLPLKIANALEKAIHNDFGLNEIVIISAQSAWASMTAEKEIHALNGYSDLVNLMKAAEHGYEIERTLEETLEEAYNKNYIVPDHMPRKDAFKYGMRFTLQALGMNYEWLR